MGEIFEFASRFSSHSVTQLNELLEDDEKLNKIVNDMDEMLEVQQSKQMTLASNRSLAEQNLSLQPGLDQQKMQLTKRYCCLQELYEAYQLRKSTIDHSSGKSSLDTLLALLQAEGAKIEEETENLADSFLDGDLSLDAFIEAYQSKRKLAHLRRVKIDKLQEIVLKCFQMPQTSVNESTQPHIPNAPALYHSQVNGSPVPVRPPPTSLTGQQSGLPYPAASYPSVPMPNMVPSYSSPFIQQYAPALPQTPSPGLSPRTGFIMQ